MSSFRLSGLPAAPFAHYFAMSDDDLAAHHARRLVVDEEHAFPCRVSLQDATIGEEVVLVPFEHQPALSPFRATGAIYVRRNAEPASPATGEIPDYVARRLISLRAYDADGWMRDAEVRPGTEVAQEIDRMFADPHNAYIHLHVARRGCFACRVDRAT